jgi:predicted secreted protein
MATSAAIGLGSKLGIESGTLGSGTYVDMAEVTSIKFPNLSRDTIDATHMASPDGFREFIAGLSDGGEFSVEVNYIAAVADPLMAALLAGADNYQITAPNGIRWQMRAICTEYAPEAPLDDKMTASLTFKVSGKPVILASL